MFSVRLSMSVVARALLTAGAAFTVSSALATPLAGGIYRLYNHPDGNEAPPLYGARFDELFNATSGHDVFTLDFNHSGSYVTLTLGSGVATISGTAWGGRDVGGAYATDSYLGFYTFTMTYSLGLGLVPGDDDYWVNTTNHVNTGSITAPNTSTVQLVDERGANPFSLRIGNEDNDLGHRGFNGISGWGWMSYRLATGAIVHEESTDFLFTVGERVPTPGATSLLAIGGVLMGRRRRR